MIIEADLKALRFNVEESKSSEYRIKVPVPLRKNDSIDKSFDSVNKDGEIGIEVEAGRAFASNQFLHNRKDFPHTKQNHRRRTKGSIHYTL